MSSNSSTHRPAVKVTMATPTRVRNLLQKASDLEIRFETTKSNEKEKQRLRSQLCEALSDILLTDPQFAMSKDCCGRLWRTCFYSEIGTFRSLIHREKRKKGPALTSYERAQKKFLQEAIQLYNFLITSYQDRLLPNVLSLSQSPSSSQVEDSQDSQATTGIVAASPAATTAGIVEGLHRLFIHLGDLHRYAENFAKAESCYGKAAKLAPGKGNPYNQLAVVAQLKDPASPLNCVALYWYARSLLATEEPFTTSYDNLRRLLENNRQMLLKMNNTPTIPEPKPSSSTTSKKAMIEANRAHKAAASKLFLIQFVDLHFDFFTGVASSNEDEIHSLISKLECLVESLQATLQNSAFGDSLLCKMVVINVFSIVWAGQEQPSPSPPPPPPQPVSPAQSDEQDDRLRRKLTKCLAYSFLLAFGAALAERLEQMLGKVLDSPHGPEGIPSVRLLMPLLVTLDFVSTLTPQDHPCTVLSSTQVTVPSSSTSSAFGSLMQFHNTASRRFWSKVASLANLLSPLQHRVRGGCKSYELQEMKLLQGFVPLLPFTKKEDDVGVDEHGFVSVVAAMEALELGGATAMSSTQESVASAGSSSTTFSPEENKGKVSHFLQMVQHMAGVSFAMHPKLIRDPRGVYTVEPSPSDINGSEPTPTFNQDIVSLLEKSKCSDNGASSFSEEKTTFPDSTKDDMDVADDEQPDSGFVPDDDNDNHIDMMVERTTSVGVGGDVLVYKASEGGQGPALLVPGALLLTLVNDNADTTCLPPRPPQDEVMLPALDPMNMGPPVALSNYFEQRAVPSSTAEVVVPHPPESPHRAVAMDIVQDPTRMVPRASAPVALSPPRPPPGFGGMSNAPAMPPPSNTFGHHQFNGDSATSSYQGDFIDHTVGNSFPFFGSGFPSQSVPSNPFFSTSPVGFSTADGASFPGPSYNGVNGHFLDPEATASADGLSLLDSSLLSSMWMDEGSNSSLAGNHLPPTNQRNPFAAT